jgi:hypothetical protein
MQKIEGLERDKDRGRKYCAAKDFFVEGPRRGRRR